MGDDSPGRWEKQLSESEELLARLDESEWFVRQFRVSSNAKGPAGTELATCAFGPAPAGRV